MTHRSIEEVFREIAPPHSRGVPAAPVLSAGVTAGTGTGPGDLGTAMTQAGQEIAQLRQSYQQQADLIAANTQALQGNTASQGSHSATSAAGGIASTLLHGITGLFSPVISGIASLFGGGAAPVPALPVYKAPPALSIDGLLGTPLSGAPAPAPAPASAPAAAAAAAPNPAPSSITVNIHAMDSQSFLDRSADIASAVREAMLNNHPINSVVADL